MKNVDEIFPKLPCWLGACVPLRQILETIGSENSSQGACHLARYTVPSSCSLRSAQEPGLGSSTRPQTSGAQMVIILYRCTGPLRTGTAATYMVQISLFSSHRDAFCSLFVTTGCISGK